MSGSGLLGKITSRLHLVPVVPCTQKVTILLDFRICSLVGQERQALARANASKVSNWINRARPPRKIGKKIRNVYICSVHGNIGLKWYQMGPRGFVFLSNPDLADILGDMDFDSDNFYFLICWIQLSRFPGSQISRNRPGSAWMDSTRLKAQAWSGVDFWKSGTWIWKFGTEKTQVI